VSDETPEGGFIARWSRRKREAAAEPDPPVAESAPVPDAPPAPEPEAARPACTIPNLPEIDLASLPPIETLTAESDFSLFLRPGIPATLRSAALRRMWSLDPAIRDYIGPVEYQWDFNAPGGLPLGFAGELLGDVQKLLAQAIGQPDPDDAAKSAAEPDAEAPPEAEAAAPAPAALPDAPPETAPPADAAPVPLAETEPAPRPAMRRHGGALPA
jgi:hypothetical protein